MAREGSLGQLSARVSLDATDFSRNMAALKREMRTARADFRAAGAGANVFGDELTSTEGQMKALERQIGLNGQALGKHRQDFDQAKAAFKEGGSAQEEFNVAMQNAQKNYSLTQAQIGELAGQHYKLNLEQLRSESTMYQVGSSMAGFGDKMQSFGDNVQTVGKNWTAMGAAVGVGTGLIVNEAFKWERATVDMRKTIEIADSDFNKLQGSIRELALEIPVAANELGHLAALGGQLGILPEYLPPFTETVAALGVATNLSSEEAATLFAQFSNITSMDQTNFENLASSIVKIGNNSATTERDVAQMAMLLAGAGEAAGMSESEIVGLAGGLSSLGIAAERGGSSFSKLIVDMAVSSETGVQAARDLEQATGMTIREIELMSSNASGDFKEMADALGMTTSEINNIVKSANSLEGFAEVSGLSAEQFSKAFGEDAVGAIALFIEGLSKGAESGETAIQVLDELGISEIRLRDSLLRAGNAQDFLTESVNLSNEAWEENTELQREAGIYYESTENQMQLVKNQLVDSAIAMGEAVLPALVDLLGAVDPLIDGLSSLADWFVNLDESTQQWIVTAGAILTLGGPLVLGFGKLISTMGIFTSGIGKSIMAIADFTLKGEAMTNTTTVVGKALEHLAGSAGFEGLASTITGKAVGALGTFGGALAPFLAGGVAVAGLSALGYGIYKWWIEPLVESSQRAEKWGSDIGEETESVLNDFQTAADGASEATYQMANDVESGASEAISHYETMTGDIVSSTEEMIQQSTEELSKFSPEVRAILQDSYDAQKEDLERVAADVETIQGRITDIYRNAMEENRELTQEELSIVETYQNQLAEMRSETLGLAAEEQKAVHAVLLEDLQQFSDEQLRTRLQLLSDQRDIDKEHYAEQRSILDENLAAGIIKQSEYNESMEILQQEERETLSNHIQEWAKTRLALGDTEEELAKNFKLLWSDTGIEYEEIMRGISESSERSTESINYAIEGLEDLTGIAGEAGQMWHDLAFDPKDGEVHTNLQEVIEESIQTEQGWENLKFIAKHADLTTDAAQTILEASFARDDWQELVFSDKNATLGTNAIEVAEAYIKANYDWDALDFELQSALMTSNSSEVVMQALKDAGIWDDIDPLIHELLADSNVPEQVENARSAFVDYNKAHIDTRDVNVNDHVTQPVANMQRAINGMRGKTVTITQRRVNQTIHETYRRDMGNRGIQRTYATGTPHHPGGLAILGDAGNAEPFLTPQGNFGISPTQDTMYDLPKGTQVWRTVDAMVSEMISNMPHYAEGTQGNALDNLNIRFPEWMSPSNSTNVSNEGDTYNVNVEVNGQTKMSQQEIDRLTERISKSLERKENSRKAARGERVTGGRRVS